MTLRIWGMALLCLTLGNRAVIAQENRDLDLIPAGMGQVPVPDAEAARGDDAAGRIYIEDATLVSSRRGGLSVPVPAPLPPDWQERVFIDLRQQWRLDDTLSVTLSDRFSLRTESDIPFPDRENILSEFREGYLSWSPLDRTYLDFGRINVKSGIALGFNPTDFFKARAIVEPLSADPSVLREDRLGTVMAFGQHVWDGGAVSVAVAPKLQDPTRITGTEDLPSLGPALDRTNADDRFLIKGNVAIIDDFSPEILLYRQGNRTSFGVNLAETIGQDSVAYAEWAGGRRSGLIDEALRFGRQTGTLPAGTPDPLGADSRLTFQTQLSSGVSYVIDAKITVNVEYHFDQAAFSRRDWGNWFRTGAAGAGSPGLSAVLWYSRAYALDQQEPIAEHSLFLRADWVDAFVPRLELTGFVEADLRDGSSLSQIEADYYLSDAWTIGASVIADIGRKQSDYGSQSQSGSVMLKLARYF